MEGFLAVALNNSEELLRVLRMPSGSAQLSDSTYNTRDGSAAALREQQGLVGLIAHSLEAFDVYAYGDALP